MPELAMRVCHITRGSFMSHGVAWIAVIGAIVGEWIGSTTGIGALIIHATHNFGSPLLYATIVVGSLFSAGFFGVVSVAERWALRWSVGDQ